VHSSACHALRCIALAGAILLASTARADDDGGDRGVDEQSVTPAERTLAVGASLVPGVMLHGAGHFAIGRRTTAYKLFALEGIGLALLLAGAIPLVVSGASRYLVRTSGVVAAMGAGLLGNSLQADIWGVAMPLDARGMPAETAPIVEAEVGYRHVHDTHFDYASFLVTALDLRWRSLHLRPSSWYALDDRNVRLGMLAGHRFFGPRPGEAPAADGSYLEIHAAVTRHRFAQERFTTVTGELFAGGRLDLVHLDPWLQGAFSELGIGIGLQAFDYDAGGLELGVDRESLLLARFGFGFYVGGPDAPRAEIFNYYEHRHDDFAGGFNEAAIGIPGHLGLSTTVYLHDAVGMHAVFEAGASLLGGASLLLRSYE
jgi:hypothetical protein